MKKKEKIESVSIPVISPLEKIYNSIDDNNIVLLPFEISDNETIELSIKKNLSLEEMLQFTDLVANNVFDENREYIPVIYNICKNIAILKFYLYGNLDFKIDDSFIIQLSYNSELIKQIESVINKNQYNDLLIATSNKTEFIKQLHLSTERELLQKSIHEAERIYEMYNALLDQFKDINIKDGFDMLRNISSKREEIFVQDVLEFNKNGVK